MRPERAPIPFSGYESAPGSTGHSSSTIYRRDHQQMLTRRSLLKMLPWGLIALASSSELFLLDWALLATNGPSLTLGGAAGALLGMLCFHVAWTLLARRLHERPSPSRVFGIEGLLFSLGIVFSGGLVGLVFVGVHLLGAWLPELPKDQWLLIGGAMALATGVGALVYSMTFGQARLALEQIDAPMRDLDPRLQGVRVAHISDLHIGRHMRAAALRRFVDRVNATQPDLIVITGDIFDFDSSYIEEGCRELAKLSAPHGTFAILGNHDVYTGADAVARGLASLTSIQLLRDGCCRLEIAGAALWMVGIEDGGESMADRGIESPVLESLARDVPREADQILLVHRPNYLPQIARLGFPLALAGHTHGGQVSLPPPIHHWNVARLLTPWTRGLFELGATRLYVNRGLGVGGLAIRWNCVREIAVLTLVDATDALE